MPEDVARGAVAAFGPSNRFIIICAAVTEFPSLPLGAHQYHWPSTTSQELSTVDFSGEDTPKKGNVVRISVVTIARL
jgi:hypothetical protein